MQALRCDGCVVLIPVFAMRSMVVQLLLTPDLSLDKHITALSAKCFFNPAAATAPHSTITG